MIDVLRKKNAKKQIGKAAGVLKTLSSYTVDEHDPPPLPSRGKRGRGRPSPPLVCGTNLYHYLPLSESERGKLVVKIWLCRYRDNLLQYMSRTEVQNSKFLEQRFLEQ